MENWEASLCSFHKHLKKIEIHAKVVLGKCIPQLKFSPQVITFLNDIENMKTRKYLVIQMNQMIITEKLTAEIENVNLAFYVSQYYCNKAYLNREYLELSRTN